MASERNAQQSSSVSRKSTPQQNEEWKCSLRFTGDNPLFPVEMFLRIIEVESDRRGLDDNDKVLEILSRIPDHPIENKSTLAIEGSPASLWKRRLMEKQRKKQEENNLSKDSGSDLSGTGGLNWTELKCDMLSEFGKPPNYSYSTIEKFNLVQSLRKGKGEPASIFLLRVIMVVNILESSRGKERDVHHSTAVLNEIVRKEAHYSKMAYNDHGSSSNSSNSSNHYKSNQTSQFYPNTSTAVSTNYLNPCSAVAEPAMSSSRQQYENWLTEQRQLGRSSEFAQIYQPNNLKNTYEPTVHQVTDYSISSSSSISNSHFEISRDQSSSSMKRADSIDRTENIGGQIDGQYDESCESFELQKDNIWVRMFFMLGLSNRDRSHLLQLKDELDIKSIAEISSYLMKQNGLEIKQELLSSSDEYEDDSDEEAHSLNNQKLIDGNHDVDKNDTEYVEEDYSYQQTLELEMEDGRPAQCNIKNEEDENSYFDESNVKDHSEWDPDEGGSNNTKSDQGHEIIRNTSELPPKRLKTKRVVRSKLTKGPFHCCDMTFESRISYRKHRKEAHSIQDDGSIDEKPNICKICGIVCDNKTEHTSHLETVHGTGKANTCPLCLMVLEDRVKRKQHRDDEHSGRRCKCYQCGKELMNFKSLESHLLLVHGKGQENTTNKLSSADDKNSQIHSDESSVFEDLGPGAKVKTTRVIRKAKGPATYICAICGEKVEGRNEMDKHTKEVHKGLKVRCDMCDYVAKGARYMARHRLAKHDLPTAGFKLLKCEIEGCKFRTTEKTSLKIHHQAVHEGARPFPCGACDKSFKFRGSLQTHVDSVHMGMRKYRCDICDRVFTSTFAVANHKTVAHHDGALPDHMCDECGLGFRLLDALKRHKRSVHLKERDFECPHCPPGSRKFFTKNILISHIRGFHQLDKQHACPECGRGFPRAYELKRHIATVHLKFRPYRCGICDARFTHYSSLGYHIAGKHEGMDFRQAKKRKAEMRKHPAFQYIGEVMEGYPE